MTLFKILCKWKQDSAVSLFLYLDFVFKNRYTLIHNQSPVTASPCLVRIFFMSFGCLMPFEYVAVRIKDITDNRVGYNAKNFRFEAF